MSKSLSIKLSSKRNYPPSLTKAKVLIVEDEQIIAMDIRNILERLGCRVCAVTADGEESVRLASRWHPDFIVMDIRLKGKIDGIQAARIIQAQKNIPVIYLSAYGDGETLDQALQTAFSYYVHKPFSETELKSKISSVLDGIKKYSKTN